MTRLKQQHQSSSSLSCADHHQCCTFCQQDHHIHWHYLYDHHCDPLHDNHHPDHHDHVHDFDDNQHNCRRSSCLAATATNLHRAQLSPRVAPWFIFIMIILSLILISHDIDESDYKQDVQGLQLFLHTNEKDVYSGFKGK